MIKHTFYVKITTMGEETALKLLREFVTMKESEYTNVESLEYWTCKVPADEVLKDLIIEE